MQMANHNSKNTCKYLHNAKEVNKKLGFNDCPGCQNLIVSKPTSMPKMDSKSVRYRVTVDCLVMVTTFGVKFKYNQSNQLDIGVIALPQHHLALYGQMVHTKFHSLAIIFNVTQPCIALIGHKIQHHMAVGYLAMVQILVATWTLVQGISLANITKSDDLVMVFCQHNDNKNKKFRIPEFWNNIF